MGHTQVDFSSNWSLGALLWGWVTSALCSEKKHLQRSPNSILEIIVTLVPGFHVRGLFPNFLNFPFLGRVQTVCSTRFLQGALWPRVPWAFGWQLERPVKFSEVSPICSFPLPFTGMTLGLPIFPPSSCSTVSRSPASRSHCSPSCPRSRVVFLSCVHSWPSTWFTEDFSFRAICGVGLYVPQRGLGPTGGTEPFPAVMDTEASKVKPNCGIKPQC